MTTHQPPRDGAREAVAELPRQLVSDLLDALTWNSSQGQCGDRALYLLQQNEGALLTALRLSPEREADWPIATDGPHPPGEQRRWLARQLMDSRLSEDEALGVVAFHPLIKDKMTAALSPEDGRGKEGPSSELTEATSGAVAGTETAFLLNDLHSDLQRRGEACRGLLNGMTLATHQDGRDAARIDGKAAAYEHAAELVEAALLRVAATAPQPEIPRYEPKTAPHPASEGEEP